MTFFLHPAISARYTALACLVGIVTELEVHRKNK
jgi:hypothetical protein